MALGAEYFEFDLLISLAKLASVSVKKFSDFTKYLHNLGAAEVSGQNRKWIQRVLGNSNLF